MDVAEISIRDRLKMRKMHDLAVIEIMHEPGSDDYYRRMDIDIERKAFTSMSWKMVRITCIREEIADVINRYLDDEILPEA